MLFLNWPSGECPLILVPVKWRAAWRHLQHLSWMEFEGNRTSIATALAQTREQRKGGRGRLSVTAASMSTEPESAANNPGYCDTADAATKDYFVQQTMYRIKDPKASLEFYSKVLGMTLIKKLDFEEAKFSLYFLGYESPEAIPNTTAERTAFLFRCKATLELTHNWGTESDPNFKGYHNGNNDPRGYGHIGITVDDVYKACERFEKLGVQFAKRPDDGRMKGLAFIKDPDGYWIEIFDVGRMSGLINGPSS